MLVLIGVFKLAKALLLIVVGISAIRMLHRDVPATISHFVQVLRIDPENRYIHGALAKVFRVMGEEAVPVESKSLTMPHWVEGCRREIRLECPGRPVRYQ